MLQQKYKRNKTDIIHTRLYNYLFPTYVLQKYMTENLVPVYKFKLLLAFYKKKKFIQTSKKSIYSILIKKNENMQVLHNEIRKQLSFTFRYL